eukprot:18155-Heterococcus_DN1.PRE.8
MAAAVCDVMRFMETASFDDAMLALRSQQLIASTEAALRSLRMGREIRAVPANARTARAFLACALVNYFPASALDDGGALSSPLTDTSTAAAAAAAVQLDTERQRLVRAAGAAVSSLLALEALLVQVHTVEDGELASLPLIGRAVGAASVFRSVARSAASVSRARVAFCARFDAWKQLDAERLAVEMTRACEDVLLMQMRAERDLRAAAEAYGLGDDGSAVSDGTETEVTFATGFEQIKQGTAHQVSRMLSALTRLIGREAARERITAATGRAHSRLLADEDAEDDVAESTHASTETEPETEPVTEPLYTEPLYTELGEHSSNSSTVYTTNVGADSESANDNSDGESPTDAGTSRPLSAGDLLSNEWLVHEIMVSSDEHIQVSLDEAVENRLLDDTSASPFPNGRTAFWAAAATAFAAQDYTPLLQLIATLRDRIIGLTPRRKDLAAETAESMDVQLLEQMARHGALQPGAFFKLALFAGGRVLELEAPVRNEETAAQLREWETARKAVETGVSPFTLEMVRTALEYLLFKVDEIHLDILNAHLQFVTPFLRRNGVEYERDRFVEKLDAGEVTLEKTHVWLQKAVTRLRATAASETADATAAIELVRGLEAQRGDAYLELLRGAMVDELIGGIVRADGTTGVTATAATPTEAARLSAAQVAVLAEESAANSSNNSGIDGLAIPETLMMDQYRLVVIAAGIEQVAYTAALIAFSKQVLGALKVTLQSTDETDIRKSLMTLFETQDVTSADITAQIVEMCRAVAAKAQRVLPASHINLLTSRAKAILTTGDCPVYKLYLKRVLLSVKALLVSGGAMSSPAFEALLRARSLSDYQDYLVNRVCTPLARVQKNSELVYSVYYNEIIPLCLHQEAHAAAMNVD